MHMNQAPHLLPEDRPEFERAVDEALREADKHPALSAVGEQAGAQRLRVMALSAATAIAADAAEEYEQYVTLRTRLRESAVDAPSSPAPDSSAASSSVPSPGPRAPSGSGERRDEGEQRGGTGGLSLAGVGEGVGETSGAGLLAMVSVLVPLLAGAAAVIFLLLGNLLRVVSPEPSIAAPMRGAGLVFAVLAAAGIVVAMAELWLTALRHGAGARRTRPGEAASQGGTDAMAAESALVREVSAARTAWREALLERGIVPFLADALAGLPSGGEYAGGDGNGRAGTDATGTTDTAGAAGASGGGSGGGSGSASGAASPREPASGGERSSRFGYSGPDFSSRSPSDGDEYESHRPRYSSPDYSSPEYGGPEHKPE